MLNPWPVLARAWASWGDSLGEAAWASVVEAEAARRSALRHVLDTFFEGSAAGAMAALLGGDGVKLTAEELERMEALIKKARKEGM